jgi:uncharacterized membrane protein YccC
MAAPVVAQPVGLPASWRYRLIGAAAGLRPVWSVPAALRAVRAAVVVPGVFALAGRVIGNPQMATFAAFGGFATLVLAGFGGGRRDRLVAHAGLAVAGSVLLVIGTAVNSMTAVAAVVTLPVAFCVLFAGVTSANAASGATAALLAYVLPAASPGTMSMVPSRLAGWWLASAAGTIAVMILYAAPPTDRLRRAISGSARALADQIEGSVGAAGAVGAAEVSGLAEASAAAKHALLGALTEVPYRPTGLTIPDQAIAGLVEALQWCTVAVAQAVGDGTWCSGAQGIDRDRLVKSSEVLRLTAELVGGRDASTLEAAVHGLDATMAVGPGGLDAVEPGAMHQAFHSRVVGAAARTAGLDALIAARRLEPADAAEEGNHWWGQAALPAGSGRRHPLARATAAVLGRNSNLRSIWFLNSARGAIALAAAVTIADVTNVQHGFWIVLGALSVLRTSAASTGATALRALAGTVVGFVVGAAVILAIGSHTSVLWAVLPLAVLVAAYAPGTAPFAVGQAAFTVTISVLYNIVVPVGWKVGELRVEDVAIGVAVAAVAGVLFWPRGATAVVARDLADAFHAGGVYLVQATAWALGVREEQPDGAVAVVSAGVRLDDALRSLFAEQGTKRVARETLWRLVGGALRIRLMAQALARSRPPGGPVSEAEALSVMGEAVRVAGRYDDLAARLGHTPTTVAQELAGLRLGSGEPAVVEPRSRWVHHHVEHLRLDLDDLDGPAQAVADRLRSPWWR